MFLCLPAKPNHFKNNVAVCLVIVGLCLLTLSDKTRTMCVFMRQQNGHLIEGAFLMASLTVSANRHLNKDFFSSVRELSVSFTRRRKWKNKRTVHGAAMRNARIARTTDGQH